MPNIGFLLRNGRMVGKIFAYARPSLSNHRLNNWQATTFSLQFYATKDNKSKSDNDKKAGITLEAEDCTPQKLDKICPPKDDKSAAQKSSKKEKTPPKEKQKEPEKVMGYKMHPGGKSSLITEDPCNPCPRMEAIKVTCPPPSTDRQDKDSKKKDDESKKKAGADLIKLIIIGLLLLLILGLLAYILTRPSASDQPCDEKAGTTTATSEKKKKHGSRKKKQKKIIPKCPKISTDIPDCVPYLLIGGGTASFSAFRSIKSLDPKAKVLVVSSEGSNPYMRPPLSKEIWFNDENDFSSALRFKQWNGTERSLFYEPEDFYVECKSLLDSPNGGVAVARGWSVKKIDVFEKKAYLDDGKEIKYDKCLIATGSSPKNLPVFEDAGGFIQDKISLYRGVTDYEDLLETIRVGAKSIIIVGGGFLGSELACSLGRLKDRFGFEVYQVFKESGNLGSVLPQYLSEWTTERVKEEGVTVVPNSFVKDVDLDDDDEIVLSLSSGERIKGQHVIVAIGVDPNVELAQTSGLEIDDTIGGYLVNAELMARSNLWVAGDCTCFFDVKLGRRRVEHHDHAVVSGRLAGENMAGAGKPYWHQSMFWSDLGPNVGFEAIGIIDSSFPTVGVFAKSTTPEEVAAIGSGLNESQEQDKAKTESNCRPASWDDDTNEKKEQKSKKAKSAKEDDKKEEEEVTTEKKPEEEENYGKGVIFYLKNDTVVGILLWNIFNRMTVARQVLRNAKPNDDLNEVAKLFNIHDE